jgi:hypothetical protein
MNHETTVPAFLGLLERSPLYQWGSPPMVWAVAEINDGADSVLITPIFGGELPAMQMFLQQWLVQTDSPASPVDSMLLVGEEPTLSAQHHRVGGYVHRDGTVAGYLKVEGEEATALDMDTPIMIMDTARLVAAAAFKDQP